MAIDIIQTAIIGTASGAGSAIGSYLSNLLLIRHLEKLGNKIKERKKK